MHPADEAAPRPSFRHSVLESLAGRVGSQSATEDLRLQTLCLMILTALAAGAAAHWLADVLVPFVFAIFLTFALQPLIDVLTRRLGMPRGLATTITLAVAVLLLVALAAVVSASVMQLTQSGQDYKAQVTRLLDRVLSALALQRFGVNPTTVLSSVTQGFADSFGQVLAATFNSLFSLVSHGTVVLIYLIFLLFGSGSGRSRTGLWEDIRTSIEHYLFVKTVISLVVGALTWLILDLLDVQLALVFGLLAFALNFIPNVGPIVATLLPLPVVVLTPDVGLGTATLAILLPGAVHFLVGHLVEPRIMGESLELDPVVVLLALMLASVLWGPIGMLLATPMTAVARILLERMELTKPVAAVLAGRSGGTVPAAGVPDAATAPPAGEESLQART